MTTQTLRMSISHGNMRPSSSSAALGGSNPPRDHRRDRRKPATAESTSPSSFGGIVSNTSVATFQRARSPSPTSPTRLEENYLAAKRRAHRQSYFDHYPERSAQRRREKSRDELEDGSRSEGMEVQPPLHTAFVGVATHGCNGEAEDEDDTFETYGRTTIRKSLSVGGGERYSNSLAQLSRKGKERNGLASSEIFDHDQIREASGGGSVVAFPTMRDSISNRDAQRHPQDASSSSSLHPQQKSLNSTTSHSRNFITPKAAIVPYGAYRDDVPTLRYSYSTYSSSQTQGETLTPPQTPVEPSVRGPIHVVVAAPVPGVEAMDALVDGMDGSDEDELFKRLQSSVNKRSLPSHHPLYSPPLPQPPAGIVLGHGYPSRKGSLSSENDDEDGEGLQVRSSTLGGKERSSAKRRHEGGRTGSSSTILADVSDRGHQRPSTASTLTQEEHERAPPPSIDEIIRKHTAAPPHLPSYIAKKQLNGQSQSRPASGTKSPIPSSVGHRSLSDSDPEPLTPSEEAALVARSSIDSVTAEVQQSLRLHKPRGQSSASSAATSNTSITQEDTPSNSKRYSYYSYKTSRSVGGCDQSIRSGSASASASTSNGAGINSGSPALMSDPELPLDLLALQQSNGKRPKQDSQKEAIATYLRSARMTTLLKLTRRPHASSERPLTVSLSDLGSPTGFPLVVFLGLGCVRYVMGLYDEMAECLGLRLITIDRWGLGRTDVPPLSASRGVPEWSTVVEEVLDRLNIDKCAVMAHSAGAPYALSFASKNPQRVVGDICLLAPWVGGGAGGGYRWLKYVPNGLLKTAQAAEWKIQAWMIGKPPKITHEGIGYNVNTPVSSATYNLDSTGHFVRAREQALSFDEEEEYNEASDLSPRASLKRGKSSASVKSSPYTIGGSSKSRPSISSGNTFSDYDDLADFNGRFDSQPTFERRRARAASADGHTSPEQGSGSVTRKRPSKGFLRIWKGLPRDNPGPVPPLPNIETTLNQQQQSPQTPQPKKKLKSLKSISSIKSRSSTTTNVPARPRTAEKSPVLPEQDFETSLQFVVDEFGLKDTSNIDLSSAQPNRPRANPDTKMAPPRASTYSADSVDTRTGISSMTNRPSHGPRVGGRRSISFTSTTSAPHSLLGRPPLPQMPHTLGRSSATPSVGSSSKKENGESFQVAMGNALIASSHSESARGTHPDLLQILNHEQRPWGFSYARYPHKVRVWYGDKDERIASDAVKWMEAAMGQDRCRVTVVKGADHGLMYRTNVVVDVLEEVRNAWAEAVHGPSRKREHSTRSEPNTPSGLEFGVDPFKHF